jgi:hypothetical protein
MECEEQKASSRHHGSKHQMIGLMNTNRDLLLSPVKSVIISNYDETKQ